MYDFNSSASWRLIKDKSVLLGKHAERMNNERLPIEVLLHLKPIGNRIYTIQE